MTFTLILLLSVVCGGCMIPRAIGKTTAATVKGVGKAVGTVGEVVTAPIR